MTIDSYDYDANCRRWPDVVGRFPVGTLEFDSDLIVQDLGWLRERARVELHENIHASGLTIGEPDERVMDGSLRSLLFHSCAG